MPNRPVDCSDDCGSELPFSYIVREKPSERRDQSPVGCERTLLYLVDDAGTTSATDTAPWLTVDSNKTVTTVDDLVGHYTACNRIYAELSAFFSLPVVEGVRGSHVTLVLIEGTLEETLARVLECDTCFAGVTYPHYKANGDANFDLAGTEALDLATLANAHNKLVSHPTMAYADLLTQGEATTTAARAKALGLRTSLFVLSRDVCVDELDETTCLPTGNTVTTTGIEHLAALGVLTSYRSDTENYNFTLMFKPLGNLGIPRSNTSSLNSEEVDLVIGRDADATHHVNVYHKVDSVRMLLTGINALGEPMEDVVHSIYVQERLNKPLLELLSNSHAISKRDIVQLEISMQNTANSFVGQQFVHKDADEIPTPEGFSLVQQRDGWALFRNKQQSDKGAVAEYRFCYATDEQVLRITLNTKANCGEI